MLDKEGGEHKGVAGVAGVAGGRRTKWEGDMGPGARADEQQAWERASYRRCDAMRYAMRGACSAGEVGVGEGKTKGPKACYCTGGRGCRRGRLLMGGWRARATARGVDDDVERLGSWNRGRVGIDSSASSLNIETSRSKPPYLAARMVVGVVVLVVVGGDCRSDVDRSEREDDRPPGRGVSFFLFLSFFCLISYHTLITCQSQKSERTNTGRERGRVHRRPSQL